MTRRKQGVPVQPKGFFYEIFDNLVKNNFGFFISVYYEQKVIASGLFLFSNNVFTYKYGASDPRFLYLRPNHLLFWEAIKYAKENGYAVFDFGKTDIKNVGLRKFKSGWGAIEKPLYYSYYPEVPDASKLNYIKNKIVAPIIRHSPVFVCRWVGELFYKYFG